MFTITVLNEDLCDSRPWNDSIIINVGDVQYERLRRLQSYVVINDVSFKACQIAIG